MDENTQLTPEEQGEAFEAAVENSGVTIDYGGMSDSQKLNYWISMSAKYNGTDWDGSSPNTSEFFSDINLSSGNTVQKNYEYLGDYLAAEDEEIYENLGNGEINIAAEDGIYKLTITDNTTVYRQSENAIFRIDMKGTAVLEKPDSSYINQQISGLSSGVTYPYWNQEKHGFVWSVSKNENEVKIIAYWNYSTMSNRFDSDGGGASGIWEHSSTQPSETIFTIDSATAESFTITFTFEDSGGGGGGGGSTTTLEFTAAAGMSGRHSDMISGNYSRYVPSNVETAKRYGCGGDGGNGGGGGGGAATVIIRQFTTRKADTVQQIAKAKRHGYGSGGGKGGKGGDGCILIFW